MHTYISSEGGWQAAGGGRDLNPMADKRFEGEGMHARGGGQGGTPKDREPLLFFGDLTQR